MIEKIALRAFWIATFTCASCVMYIVWTQPDEPGIIFKLAATSFITGLASWLVWVPLVTYRFYNTLKK